MIPYDPTRQEFTNDLSRSDYEKPVNPEGDVAFWRARAEAAEANCARLEKAIAEAADELGVPVPGYPQPVANAAEILGSMYLAHRMTFDFAIDPSL